MSRCIYCKNSIKTIGYRAENAGGYICGDCYNLCSYEIQKDINNVTYEEVRKSIEEAQIEIGRKNRIEFQNQPNEAKKRVRKNTRLALIVSLIFIIIVFFFVKTSEIRQSDKMKAGATNSTSYSQIDNKKTEVSIETSAFFILGLKSNYCSSTA
ncbi:MAG: hypothetical protein PUD72_07870 [Oscillospiraceae bacterium]|nr:hypothetical protein [Oscillospiraceae bacterium]